MLHELVKCSVTVVIMLGSACAHASGNDNLKTFGGWELGGQLSSYEYVEPGEMREWGDKAGIATAYTGVRDDGFYALNMRYEVGDNTYSGSGTMNKITDKLLEVRLLSGADCVYSGFSLAPYFGVGFRQLFNDARGTTSTGARGYRRLSQYFYVPLGLIHRIPLYAGSSRIATTLEYDLFVSGRQTSYLSDTGQGFPDVVNHQKSGYGLKAAVAYETRSWTYGIFSDFWRIARSDPTDFIAGATFYVGWEPEDFTRETGIFIKRRF